MHFDSFLLKILVTKQDDLLGGDISMAKVVPSDSWLFWITVHNLFSFSLTFLFSCPLKWFSFSFSSPNFFSSFAPHYSATFLSFHLFGLSSLFYLIFPFQMRSCKSTRGFVRPFVHQSFVLFVPSSIHRS